MTPIVGIVANSAKNPGTHVRSHTVFDAYVACITDYIRCVPTIIPCLGTLPLGAEVLADAYLGRLDGLLLPGSLSNVHPSIYGAVPGVGIENFDEARDATSFSLIRAAISRGLPLLGICRGAQEINCALGGSLDQSVHTLQGRLDHRARQDLAQHLKYGPAHSLSIRPDSWLARKCSVKGLTQEDLQVNSLHAQAIAALGHRLVADAHAPDGVVEAISMPSAQGFLVGVQWHPEWHVKETRINALILDSFKEAISHYHFRHRSAINERLSADAS